jgi:hypothetical protein
MRAREIGGSLRLTSHAQEAPFCARPESSLAAFASGRWKRDRVPHSGSSAPRTCPGSHGLVSGSRLAVSTSRGMVNRGSS